VAVAVAVAVAEREKERENENRERKRGAENLNNSSRSMSLGPEMGRRWAVKRKLRHPRGESRQESPKKEWKRREKLPTWTPWRNEIPKTPGTDFPSGESPCSFWDH